MGGDSTLPDWATFQERMRHNEALYWVGEWTILFLMWHILDFEAGLVRRCHRCYGEDVDQRIAKVYNQPAQNRCPDCFGTTFEGGFRARIVRPAIFSDADESDQANKRGMMHPTSTNVETTVDFRMREGDFLVRADNTRWRASTPRRTMLRTGFGHPTQALSAISYNNARVALEDRASVAYLLPTPDVDRLLNARSFMPPDFSVFEQINGPLIPSTLLS